MVELQAEDVKEALAEYNARATGVLQPWMYPLAAAARAWLASQATTEGRYVEPAGSSEQTPEQKITEEMITKAAWAICNDHGADPRPCFRHAIKAHDALVAALVGFHPQPEGDER